LKERRRAKIPLEVLRAEGIAIPALPPEDAAALRAKYGER
jgi:hypothetical protein